jgi:hypothetical protein
LAAVGMALMLVVTACTRSGPSSDDEHAFGNSGGDTTAADGNGSGPSGGSDDGGTGTTVRKQMPTTAEESGGSTTTTTGSGGGSTTRPSASPDSGARGGPGAYARTLLQPQRSERIVVELLVQQGAAPRQATLDHVTSVLRDASGKPVTVDGPVALPAGDGTTTDAEIRQLADRHGRAAQTTEQAVIRLLFLNGRYVPEDGVLGVAVRGDTAAVFSQQVRNTSRPLPADALEVAVTTHEVGHLLGLVDLVLHTGREDPEHEGHSPNEESVMYWAIESSLVFQVLSGPPPRDFAADDRRDLATIRNGG